MSSVSFSSTNIDELSGRKGKLRIGDKEFETPLYLPIINIMTGPPDAFRQGGIWKNIKEKLLREDKLDPFMTQILHFLDFDLPKDKLDDWKEKTLSKWIEEGAGYSPTIFADSGGFKLLFYEGIDTSKYNISPTPEDILELQLDFGADVFATLDYPITHDLVPSEKESRKKKTILNSLKTLNLMKGKERERAENKLVLLPIHGYDFTSSFEFTQEMLDKIDKNDYRDLNFGLAIGSLVPLSMSQSYKRMINIVAGVLYGIKKHDSFDHADIPTHVFGISSLAMPVLAAMGVDSFDSASYANNARNLGYKKEFNDGSTKFYELEGLDCDCRHCEKLREGGLERAKDILRAQPIKKHKFNGKDINKSEIYALIACHNHEKIKKSMEKVKKSMEEGSILETLVNLYSPDKINRLLEPMNTYYENLSTRLHDYSTRTLHDWSDKTVDLQGIKLKNLDSVAPVPRERGGQKSLSYTPRDYNVLDTDYKPAEGEVLIFTSCSKEKPYSTSETVGSIVKTVNKVDSGKGVEIIVVSGLYGPVPLIHENKEPVRNYDYKLHESNEERINLIKERTLNFIKRYRENFKELVAYITSKPYRKVMELVAKEFESLVILPEDPNTRTVREFTRKENLSQLEDFLRNSLG